jgi:HEAT repeat protein
VYFSDDDIACVYELFTKRGDTQSYYWLVKYLVQIERPFGFEKLFSLFLQDNEAVRRIARQGIVKIAPDERYGLLLRMLDLKQEREVCFAAEELGVVGKIQAIPELLNLLEQSDNEKIQVSVLRALGRLQDPRSLRALEKSVKNGSPRIQEEAIVSLYKFTSIPNHRFLKKCFESDSSRVLEVSYFTAARSRDRRIEPYLAQGLAKQSNTTLQFNILSSLRRIQTRPLYEMVCWLALDGVSSEVRMIAQSALRRSRSKRMLSWLLKDEKKMAGRQKVLILKLMADYTDEKKIFNIISKNAMTGREGQSRLLAIEILGTIAARESRNVLAKIITTGDEFSYAATIAYLNHVQPEDWPFINQILLKREKKI